MSYAIIRNANYKKDDLAGLYKHNKRKNTEPYVACLTPNYVNSFHFWA